MADTDTNVPGKKAYISLEEAEAAMIALRQEDIEAFGMVIPECFPSTSAIEALNKIPAADVRPVVHGKWEKHEDFDPYGGGRFVEWVCSECDKRLRGDWATRNHIEETPTENFCPNCGADCRGGNDGK